MTFVDRFVSEDKLQLADAGIDVDITQAIAANADPDPTHVPDVKRADLVFYGVRVSRGSYEGRIFFNNTDADADTPTDAEHGYAGSFWIFGHDGCAGDEGHCEPDWGVREDAIDFTRPHHLLPEPIAVTITEALYTLPGLADGVRLTVVAVRPGGESESDKPPLKFDEVRLVTYE